MMNITEDMEFGIWLRNGIERGWVSPPFCGMHDETPQSGEEVKDLEEFGETCLRSVRLWR